MMKEYKDYNQVVNDLLKLTTHTGTGAEVASPPIPSITLAQHGKDRVII